MLVRAPNGKSNGIETLQVEKSTTQICLGAANIEKGLWRPVQAQCVKYRQEGQSCVDQPLSFPNSNLNPELLVRKSDGMPFERPLVCAPDLICTGPKYHMMPNTCVRKRPKDTCYTGSSWDSSECPRNISQTDFGVESGLVWGEAINAIRTALLSYPAEVASPMSCQYWDNATAQGKDAAEIRKKLWDIFGILWPSRTLPAQALYETFSTKHVPNPFSCPGITTGAECQKAAMEDGHVPNCVQEALVQARDYQSRPCKLWSVIHFYMHNLVEPVTAEVANAAQALATFFGEKLTSADERDFYRVGVLGKIGLPPTSTNREDIAKWYWYAHNIVSEHASTRGAQPWLMQLSDQNAIQTPDGKPPSSKQNSWFMPWETAVRQWTANWDLEILQSSYCDGKALQDDSLPVGLSAGDCLQHCLAMPLCGGYNLGNSLCTLLENPFVLHMNDSYTCYYVVKRSLR